MKVAFISTIRRYPWGGADAVWTRAAEAAIARGDQILVAVTPLVIEHPRVRDLIAAGAIAHKHRIDAGPPRLHTRLWRRMQKRAGIRPPLTQELGAFRPDLVIVSCGGTYDLGAEPALLEWLVESKTRFRIVANLQLEHPDLPEAERIGMRNTFERADSILFLSERNLEITRRHLLAPLPNASVVQIPLRWTGEPPTPWPEHGTWSLAAVGRLESEKGISQLLHAIAGALPATEPWEINIYGRGAQEEYLRATAIHVGLSGRAHFRGFVDGLAELWSGNHLFVSPALDEGVPMTIPEAMIHGRPVLATRVGGAETWIQSGRNGFLCDAPTLPFLSAALADAWSKRADWRMMGEAAAIDARHHYQPDDYLRLIK